MQCFLPQAFELAPCLADAIYQRRQDFSKEYAITFNSRLYSSASSKRIWKVVPSYFARHDCNNLLSLLQVNYIAYLTFREIGRMSVLIILLLSELLGIDRGYAICWEMSLLLVSLLIHFISEIWIVRLLSYSLRRALYTSLPFRVHFTAIEYKQETEAFALWKNY